MSVNGREETTFNAAQCCSCATFERLDGASVNAYIKAFLVPFGEERDSFRCRICGRQWERRTLANMARPSLVRLD